VVSGKFWENLSQQLD